MTEPTIIIPVISAITVGIVGGTGYLISLVHRTRETYVPKTDCKEDREIFRTSLDRVTTEIKESLVKHENSVERIHKRIDLILTTIKENGKQI